MGNTWNIHLRPKIFITKYVFGFRMF
jgi:hypothetical protein